MIGTGIAAGFKEAALATIGERAVDQVLTTGKQAFTSIKNEVSQPITDTWQKTKETVASAVNPWAPKVSANSEPPGSFHRAHQSLVNAFAV